MNTQFNAPASLYVTFKKNVLFALLVFAITSCSTDHTDELIGEWKLTEGTYYKNHLVDTTLAVEGYHVEFTKDKFIEYTKRGSDQRKDTAAVSDYVTKADSIIVTRSDSSEQVRFSYHFEYTEKETLLLIKTVNREGDGSGMTFVKL